VSAEVGQETTLRWVLITSGRFAGATGRLLGAGMERVVVDLGVPIDGGNGIVSVPVSAVREVEW
jgi:hypothetical protein